MTLTPAQRFIDQYRDRIEAALETMIGEYYDKELEGAPSRLSQYGIPYEESIIVSDVDLGDETAVLTLIYGTENWIKRHKGPAIVWRRRPTLHLSDLDHHVRLRFRAHVLQEIPECLP